MLLVTALYEVPSKFSFDQYILWASTFLNAVQVPTVVFCEDSTSKKLPTKNFITYEILPLQEFQAMKKQPSIWPMIFEKHPERNTFKSWQLGAIWYEKKEFVLRAIAKQPDHEHQIWCDIGVLRHGSYLQPMQQFGKRLPKLAPKFHILQLRPFKECRHDLQHQLHSEVQFGGGIFGAPKNLWPVLSEHQDTVFNQMLALNQDVFKDQSVWYNVVKRWPHLFEIHTPKEAKSHCEWFTMLQVL